MKVVLFLTSFAIVCFGIGFGVGQNWTHVEKSISWPQPGEDKLLPPQAFIPESQSHKTSSDSYWLTYSQVPLEEVTFEFPTAYEDTGIDGDQLWRDLLPCKLGISKRHAQRC
jgi:hypothetical protein